jgi:uncharacterized NAD(P)/FAD-binding protein YdhS
MKYTTQASIAIVGGGPRGTSTLERICASARDFVADGSRVRVHIIDPVGCGAGSVWRTDQSSELLMNTVSSQITLFTDDTVECDGPISRGPSLYEWAAMERRNIGPNQYPTRALYGEYLASVFKEVVDCAPPHVEIRVHKALATQLQQAHDGRQSLTLDNGAIINGLSAVILAQGHLPLNPDNEQQQTASYAKRNGLRYFTPSNPADLDLSVIAPGESVCLKGLGLNFFDHMALMTTGRGGKFVRRSDGNLRYIASGNEPRLFASSRRGIPYHARGDNEKGAHGRTMPVVFTEDVIRSFRKQAVAGTPPDFMAQVWPLITKEIELVYYEALLLPIHGSEVVESFRNLFLAVEPETVEKARLLSSFGIHGDDVFSWERLQKPTVGRTFNNVDSWREWMVNYLRKDAAEAAKGNVSGPLKAALDMMRDLRNELRLVIDHDGISGSSRRNALDRWYTPLNGFLSIGPPRLRIEQMAALIEAGVLDVLGPRMQVRQEDGAWVAHSPDVQGSTVRCTTLIEARLPEPDVRTTGDKLLANLLSTGQCRPYTTVDGYQTGGLDVTASPYHIVDVTGSAHPRRFAVGVPTEGVHWVTAAGARPGVNSITLCDTDAIAVAALKVASTEAFTNIFGQVPDIKQPVTVSVAELMELDM